MGVTMKLCVNCKFFSAPAGEPIDPIEFGLCTHPKSISVNPVDGSTKALRAFISRNSIYHGCGLEGSFYIPIHADTDDEGWLSSKFGNA